MYMCMYYMISTGCVLMCLGFCFIFYNYHYLIIVLKYENTFVIIIKTFTNIRCVPIPYRMITGMQ